MIEWEEPYTIWQKVQIRYVLTKLDLLQSKERMAMRIARRLPRQIRLWVLIQAASEVWMEPNQIIEPHNITYPQMYATIEPPRDY